MNYLTCDKLVTGSGLEIICKHVLGKHIFSSVSGGVSLSNNSVLLNKMSLNGYRHSEKYFTKIGPLLVIMKKKTLKFFLTSVADPFHFRIPGQ